MLASQTLPSTTDDRVPTRRLWHWCVLAARMLRRAPLRLGGLVLLPMLVEAVLQVGIPLAGMVASKLLVPLVSMWALVAVDQFCRSGRFAPAQAARRLGDNIGNVLLLAVLTAGVFVFQLGVTGLLTGTTGVLALLSGDAEAMAALHHAQLAIILASGVLPGLLLFFTAPRVLLDARGIGAALVDNLQEILRSWRPVLLLTALMAMMVGAIVYWPLMLLPVLLLGYVPYWAYRDRFATGSH